MGTPITGREITVGVKKAATWGTPVACAANDGVLALAHDLSQAIEILRDEPMGLGYGETVDLGKETSGGSMRVWGRYDGLSTLLALAMGVAGAPVQQGGTTAYLHTLKLADVLDGLFCTMASKKKSDEVHEWPGVKVSGFTIKGSMRAPLEITFDLVGSTLARNAGAGTNNTTSIASVTYRDKGNRMVMDENGYVRINDQSGAGLAVADNVYPSEFTLTFKRQSAGDHVIDGTSYIDEPRETGFPEATLELLFPQYRDANKGFWDNFTAKTAKKIELFTKGALISGAYNYQMTVQLPNAFVEQIDAKTDGPGKIPSRLLFRLMGVSAAPTGMTGMTKPLGILLQNKQSTDALA